MNGVSFQTEDILKTTATATDLAALDAQGLYFRF